MTDFEVKIASAGKTVACRNDQTVLDAFLRQRVWLPNSCNQGTCGTCKLRVLDGQIDHGQSPEYTLTTEERERGLALGCQSRPLSDLAVEPVGGLDEDDSPHFPLKDHTGTVVGLNTIARETKRLVIELDDDMDFLAGQYAELQIPHLDGPVWRQYSMANSPSDTRTIEFQIRRTEGGAATDAWIFGSMQLGDRIELRGPLGDFVLGDDEPAILLAGGTGLAPLSSMLRSAFERGGEHPIHLYHGVREQADLYDTEWLTELSHTHERFTYIPCISRGQWDGRTGYVGEALLEDFDNLRSYSGYLCGPPAMVEAGIKALKRRRMAPRRIYREKFTETIHPQSDLTLA
ncbi:NADH:ubiquinone reductase (Na(+)-transporting) subunit F [Rhodococcus opacus]|uniref:NADH:ubiquinone reductase (Na(+)-transporting) subunit F n=1 Tax=Rhodococcus opacus TaxID=37919 RepID=UPI000A8BAD95|nr:2Fe-2S iron-sulfur cluster-binding protein [Rhodococcus opacus]